MNQKYRGMGRIVKWACDGVVESTTTAQDYIRWRIVAINPRNREAPDGVMIIHLWSFSIDHRGYNYNLHINPPV